MQLSGPPLVAVATGIIGSAWAAGTIGSLSLITTPALKTPAESATQTWAELYKRGHAIMPKVALTVALVYGYAAYGVHNRGGEWTGFAAAAGTVLAIVPYTLAAMTKTNDALHKIAKDGISGSEPQVAGLLHTWTLLNFGRSLFPLGGAVIGVISLLNTL